MKKKKSFGIAYKLNMATVVGIILVFVFFTAALISSITGVILKNEKADLVQEAGSLHELIELELTSLKNILMISASNPLLINELISKDFTLSNAFLLSVHGASEFLKDIFLTDSSGWVVAAYDTKNIGMGMTASESWKKSATGEVKYYVDPYPRKFLADGHAVLNIASPVYSKGKVIGVLGMVFDIERFANAFLLPKLYGKSGYPFVLDDMSTVFIHPDEKLRFADLSGEEFVGRLLASEELSGTLDYTWEGVDKTLAFRKLDEFPWFVAITVPKNEVLQVLNTIVTVIIVVSLISILIIAVSLSILIRKILLYRIQSFIRGLDTASTGDLGVRIIPSSHDELTFMYERFNILVENLGTLIRGVKTGMDGLKMTGRSLASNIEETAASVNQINANIESVRSRIQDQASNVTQTSAVVEELARNIESLNGLIENQSASVTESSSSIEEMIANIRSITTVSENASSRVEELRNASDAGNEKLTRVTALIGEIASMSQSMVEANRLISNIAGQTNLLAMNAAIEAAHAGEYGRGFAVVADEIRKLAEISTKQAKSVDHNLKEIKTAIDNAVGISGQAGQSFGIIRANVDSVIQVFEEIRQAMLEQSSGSRQVLSALTSMQEMTQTVKSGSYEMTAGNRQILSAISGLSSITAEIRGAIEEISKGTSEINGSVTAIAELGIENRTSIEKVVADTNRFRTEGGL